MLQVWGYLVAASCATGKDIDSTAVLHVSTVSIELLFPGKLPSPEG